MLLTAEEYPSIRGALDISIDDYFLPDAIIELPIYGVAAELWVLQRDPLAASRMNAAGVQVRLALVLYCASLIAPAVPTLLSESEGPYAYSMASVDWDARATALRVRAEQTLSIVINNPVAIAARIPRIFTVARGGRGG